MSLSMFLVLFVNLIISAALILAVVGIVRRVFARRSAPELPDAGRILASLADVQVRLDVLSERLERLEHRLEPPPPERTDDDALPPPSSTT